VRPLVGVHVARHDRVHLVPVWSLKMQIQETERALREFVCRFTLYLIQG
jgi:hypothetical protein